MAAEIDPFTQLALEHKRTQFVFYGFRWKDGTMGTPYIKLANSLREALADLDSSPGIADEGGYFVRDAFVEASDGEDPVVHVELLSLAPWLKLDEEA
jgi:hypothetical protein